MRPLGERLAIALLRWGAPPPSSPQEIAEAEAIVGLPFGAHEKDSPANASNEAICTEALGRQRELGLPLIVQWELAEALQQQRAEAGLSVGTRWHPHFNTYMFFKELRSRRPGLRKIIVVAHRQHLWRCVLVGERFGFEVRTLQGAAAIPYSYSRHWWAACPWTFLPYEALVRQYFLARGWM